MRGTWMTGLVTGVTVGLATFALTRSIQAQAGGTPPTGRIACVNVVQAFNEYQRQKDLTEEMNQLQSQLQTENTQRRQRIDALQAEIDKLDPDDPTFVGRTREMLAMQIDYKNWMDLKQADLSREVGLWSVRIYKEIVKAVGEVARRDGYDLVLYRGEFEVITMDPEVIKEQIRSTKVLYANPSIDITQVITDKLNADYRAQPRVKMMYVP